MYLKSIHLRHWGCHDDLPIAFDEGLNICIGPNGVGKSTLYHAIVAALTVKHDATNQRVAAFRSWGRDGFGPTASLEIVRADGVWSLTKTYLHEPRCLLVGDPASKASLEAKGKVAEQHLEAWLASDGAAGRLLLTLWSDQNDPISVFRPIPGVKPLPAGSLLEKVLAKAARPEAAGPFAALKRAVAEQYGERFTPQKMAIKTGSDLD
ncbi:MAG: AAA family ATPase, partial [Planctomycetaceae bacterium]|nr:AAA family ATPase [Planctomycetaceae bacterium]